MILNHFLTDDLAAVLNVGRISCQFFFHLTTVKRSEKNY